MTPKLEIRLGGDYLIFNGIDLSPYFRIKDIRGRGLINRNINAISIPGMDGEYVESVDTPSKVLEVDIRIISDDLRKTIDELNAILATDEPVPIVFPDEQDMTYYGIVEASDETGERVHLGWHDATIYIRRSDPYKYGPEKTDEFQDSGIVENKGAAEADPIFELEVLQPTTFAMVSNGEEYNMIGRPVDVDDIPTEKYPRFLQENGSSLTGWSHMTAGYAISDSMFSGIAGGSMGTTGFSFVAESFGSNPNGWTGPMIRRSFSEPLQDFKATVDISMLNLGTGVGKVVVFFLDENDDIVASMGVYDATNGYPNNKVAFRLGGSKTIVDTPGDKHGVYNNSRVWLELTREGQRFRAFSYRKRDDGTLHARNTQLFTDTRNEFQTPIQQVMIYIAKAKDYNPFEMHMHGLSVFGINDLSQNQVPYIGHPGDFITFDHQENVILINGEPRKDLKDFGGNYFKLAKGENALVVMPENSFETKVTYRERYK